MKPALLHYKSSIIAIISAIAVFALGKGYIDQATMEFISSILAIVAGWINIALPKK